MLNITLILFLLLFLIGSNPKANLRLCVRDENNKTVTGAHIYIEDCHTKHCYNLDTHSDGLIKLNNITKSKYKISIYKPGFIEKTFTLNVSQDLNCNVCLCHRKRSRIYGYITDTSQCPIERATVILYKVLKNNIYLPIQSTYSDYTGEYNFVDIPKGNYIVKAIK